MDKKAGSYMALNDVIVLACPERGTEKNASGGVVIQSNSVKKS